MKKYAIILAAGKGTRMKSSLPKCMLNFCGKTIIERIVDKCHENNFDEILVVVGYKKEIIINTLKDKVKYIFQEQQLGTADAVMCCKKYFTDKDGLCVIIPGDMPLINRRTIYNLINVHKSTNSELTIVSTILKEKNHYGRIYRENNIIKKIIEYNECTDEQIKIEEVNSGLYCANIKELFNELQFIKNNNSKNEFYFTDVVEIFVRKYKVSCYLLKDNNILRGVNTPEELDLARQIYKEKEQ